MFSKIKNFTLQIIAGANVATVILMLLVGHSDRLHPAEHPILTSAGLVFPFFILLNIAFMAFFVFVKKRFILFSFIGFLLCYFPIRTYMPLNVTDDTPEGAIKVLSYNVMGFNRAAEDEGGNPIVNYILETDADIVCLQEAAMPFYQIEKFKENYQYVDTVLFGRTGTCIALLSKYPVLSKDRIEYASKGNLSAAFKVDINGDTVTVINNHLETSGLSVSDRSEFKKIMKGEAEKDTARSGSRRIIVKLGEAAKIRAPQAEAVAEYVRNTGGSIILCGDFNDSPISYAYRTIAKELTDCYVETGNGPGISYNKNAILVRIDNIMCSDDWQPYNCMVDKSIAVSDHYPIFCWLEKRVKGKK